MTDESPQRASKGADPSPDNHPPPVLHRRVEEALKPAATRAQAEAAEPDAQTPPPRAMSWPASSGPEATAHHADTDMGEHWSVPWADLMMVMFVLFAALVAAQSLREQQTQIREREIERRVSEPRQKPQPSFEPLMRVNVFERSQQAVREANIENVEIVLLDDQSVKVSVQGPLFFELGKADLRSDVRNFLNELSVIVRQTPYQINVIGHTDDRPINTERFPSNWELSVTRASRVARYLIAQSGVDPARFTVMGRSKYEPTAPNDSERTRALNRRVEIIFTRELSADQGTPP